jgi:hypothetical protein
LPRLVIGQQNLLANGGVRFQGGEDKRAAHTGPLSLRVNQYVLQVADGGSVGDHSRQPDEAAIAPSHHDT